MNLVHRPLNKGNIIFVCLLALIPSVIITSYSVTELSVSRDSYSTDKYILFEDRDGVDQFWVDGDGFVFANGTLLSGGGGTMEQLTNVTNFGCADGQNLQVNSSGIWACATPSAGGGGGFSTVYKTADETIQSDTILTDDADLHFDVDADGIYAVMLVVKLGLNIAPDYKHVFAVPSGATMYAPDFVMTWGSDRSGLDATTPASSVGGGTRFMGGVFVLVVDTTGGTVNYQWAQSSSAPIDTTLYQGSWLAYKKLN